MLTEPPARPILASPSLAPLRTITAAKLQQVVFPPLSFAVEGLISEGLTILAGSPKVGKSWLALDIALAVACGGRALGAVEVEQRGVVVLALEDGPRRLQDRIGLLHGDRPWPTDLHLAVDRPDDDLFAALDDHLESYPGTGLIVLDTLAKVRPPSRPGDASSAYDLDYRFAGQLQKWATTRRVALVALHHDRKLASGDFVQSVSGTFGITGAADSILLLTRERGADDGLLQLTGRDIRDDLAWQLKRVGPAWQLVDKIRPELAAATAGLGDRAADVARFVVRSAVPVGASDVCTSLGLDRPLVDQYLKRLSDAGRIVRVSRGRYATPALPLSEASDLSEDDLSNLTPLTHLTPLTERITS